MDRIQISKINRLVNSKKRGPFPEKLMIYNSKLNKSDE